MSQALRQIGGVIRLELRKTFFTRRGWWVYLLALAPLGLTLMHSLIMLKSRAAGIRSHPVNQDTQIFAAIYQMYFLRLGIFFGCVGVFSNLFRGEMLEKTLHYYFLTPLRREFLVIGKYLVGAMVTLVLFVTSTGASFYLIGLHQGAAWSDFLHGAGRAQLGWYLLISALGCLGYGAVFLAAGLFIRNPMIPAAVVMVWENLNAFLPSFLKKISVIFYLKSLAPVSVPGAPPPFSALVTETDPTPAYLAVPGLLVLAGLLLFYAARSARRMEISYSE
jgi:ABC-type transport system involved in multi-copper enzyme maturation permease subunit